MRVMVHLEGQTEGLTLTQAFGESVAEARGCLSGINMMDDGITV